MFYEHVFPFNNSNIPNNSSPNHTTNLSEADLVPIPTFTPTQLQPLPSPNPQLLTPTTTITTKPILIPPPAATPKPNNSPS